MSSRYGTLTASDTRTGDRLVIAVWEEQAFLGLQQGDGILQFCPDHAPASAIPFVIGGQQSEIEGRFVIPAASVEAIARDWLLSGEESSLGHWERQ